MGLMSGTKSSCFHFKLAANFPLFFSNHFTEHNPTSG